MARKRSTEASAFEQKEMIGEHLSFAASEAYKMLRTNLLFALPPGEKGARVIGVTSSVRGEGKTTTSINLAYSLGVDGRKVLLVEADMRLPNIAKRLDLQSTPGLSDLLVGIANGALIIQKTRLHENVSFIASGQIPPNPSELLGSDHMRQTIEALRGGFDFILLDLPPINAVTDPLVVSSMVDGMIMTVRQDVSNRRALSEAMRQLKQVDAKVLGFVLTDVDSSGKSRYKKNYKKYGYGYSYGTDSYYKKADGSSKKSSDKAVKAKEKDDKK